jgi:hypothetical protein
MLRKPTEASFLLKYAGTAKNYQWDNNAIVAKVAII